MLTVETHLVGTIFPGSRDTDTRHEKHEGKLAHQLFFIDRAFKAVTPPPF